MSGERINSKTTAWGAAAQRVAKTFNRHQVSAVQPREDTGIPTQPLLRYLENNEIPSDSLKDFKELYKRLGEAIEQTEKKVLENVQSWVDKFEHLRKYVKDHPEPIMSVEKLAALDNFMVLDNSLRETTVGNIRGHTMAEKEKILDVILETPGLDEILLGVFGHRECVDTYVPEQWIKRGIRFDNAWGFVNVYDMEEVAVEGWLRDMTTKKADRRSSTDKPRFIPKTRYTEEDLHFLKHIGIQDFEPSVYESELGRTPRGLIEMKHFGVPNVVLELDLGLIGFDYKTYDVTERLKQLMTLVRDNFPKRKLENGEAGSPRVLINLRDFAAYMNDEKGFSRALEFVDALSRLPEDLRPFGFVFEEPTSILFPEQIAYLVRMTRLTMEQAGHPDARFLLHVHRGFDLSEACVLAALSNGADGVWAATCRVGANVGHACSAVTLVNLYRAGNTGIAERYSLAKVMEAARRVHEISEHKPCSPYEETYGLEGFDIAFAMHTMNWCRLDHVDLVDLIGGTRPIRINEFSSPGLMRRAMEERFGPAEEIGWDPSVCADMSHLLMEHLVGGKCLEYNTTVGLAMLYSMASGRPVSDNMMHVIVDDSNVAEVHPLLVEARRRFFQLCKAVKDHPEWYTDELFEGDSERALNMAPSFLLPNADAMMPGVQSMFDLKVPLRALLLDNWRGLPPCRKRALQLDLMRNAQVLQAKRFITLEGEDMMVSGDIFLGLMVWSLFEFEDLRSVEDVTWHVFADLVMNLDDLISRKVVEKTDLDRVEINGTVEVFRASLRACFQVPDGFDTPRIRYLGRSKDKMKHMVGSGGTQRQKHWMSDLMRKMSIRRHTIVDMMSESKSDFLGESQRKLISSIDMAALTILDDETEDDEKTSQTQSGKAVSNRNSSPVDRDDELIANGKSATEP